MSNSLRGVLLFGVFNVFAGCVFCRDLHPIKPEPGTCFDSYLDVQPISLSNLAKACVERLPTKKVCHGIKLITNEIILVDCVPEGQQLEKGCYRFFNVDLTQTVICQKFLRRNKCEIIKTPENLAIEVYCDQSQSGIVMVKNLKIT
ncbi:unnamed protein product [Phaedon cochleariae]|uniref:Uncharacterized protein n=1 Tax=Phaedon cochleariae TaxID=80249 RepID=A0A9P0GSB6_PHACE|nr:unnamed protein product [Phaedon cochleariae]